MCPEDGNCGDGFCCALRGCRSIAGAGPKTYLCYAPMY